MQLKRKRSDSEISTTSSLFSSPPSAGQFTAVNNPPFSIPTPSLFSSRTRKRHRDNRPSQAEVHQHTLSILFGAQQNAQPQSQLSPFPMTAHSHSTSVAPSHPPPQQSSLHSFWALPLKPRHTSSSSTLSTNSTPFTSPSYAAYTSATTCEDCYTSLNAEDTEDSMDIDIVVVDADERNFGCVSCGKQVCHTCAVSNLGAERKCLSCAQPKRRWEGGIGWVPI